MAAQAGAAPDGKEVPVPDGKPFYGYLFDDHKPVPQPTPVLDALLRALALHIIDEIGDKKDKFLTPAKLATFYKAAGHNFDSLFVEMPPQSISYIYQVQGCQHMIVPGDDDYAAPWIPALTEKGFSRWQSIQILLEPQIHVPVLQFAVRNWALKHPDNGRPFPPDLPSSSLPTETDPECDKWHQNCAVKLREEATPKEEPKPTFADRKVPAFVHVRAPPSPRDYFTQRPVNGPYVHIPERFAGRGGGAGGRSPDRDRERDERDKDRGRYGPRHGSSSDEPPAHRRRSVSDNPPYREIHVPHSASGGPTSRRNSQARPDRKYSTGSSTSTLDEHEPISPHTRRRAPPRHPDDPISIPVRHGYGSESGVRVGSGAPPLHTHGPPPTVVIGTPIITENGRSHLRPVEESSTRKSLHDIKEKITSFLPRDRPRSGSRTPKDDRLPPPPGHSRLQRAWSMEDETDSARSDLEQHRRRMKRLEREREREERERDGRRSADRDRSRDRDRDRVRRSRADSDRDRDRDRDRRRPHPDHDLHPDHPRRRRRDYSDDEDMDDEDLSPRSSRVGGRSRGSVTGSSLHHHHANDPYLAHPDVHRRTSSHADIDRRRGDWDNLPSSRERERSSRSGGRLYREVVPEPSDLPLRERDRRDRDRDRDRERDRDRDRDDREERWHPRDREQRERERDDRVPSPVVTGVSGRKYVS